MLWFHSPFYTKLSNSTEQNLYNSYWFQTVKFQTNWNIATFAQGLRVGVAVFFHKNHRKNVGRNASVPHAEGRHAAFRCLVGADAAVRLEGGSEDLRAVTRMKDGHVSKCVSY